LEADEVVLLDAAVPSDQKRGVPAVLVDWPSGQMAPERLVFVANQNAVSSDVEVLSGQEDRGGAREELNALYVAMTRARKRLVLAAFEPGQTVRDSWWRRIREGAPDVMDLPAPERPAPASAAGMDASAGTFNFLGLPVASLPERMSRNDAACVAEAEPADASARVGEAMHWLLEHAGDAPAAPPPERIAQAAQRFGLDAPQAARAAAMAERILAGEAAWAWSGTEILRAFNEVELTLGGARLRLDRLVQRRARDGEPVTWWVLDYKSAAHPEREGDLREQLGHYRLAIEQLYPGVRVRAAFLSAEGRLLELN
jgi:ATP-dependent helicase/nuclease subunit A